MKNIAWLKAPAILASMNETDVLLLTVFTLAFLIGYIKGILKTILGPISLFLGTILAWVIYVKYNNMALSLVAGLFGPCVVRIFLSLLCKAFISTFTADEGKEMSSLSRMFGGVFSVIWSGSLFTIFILLITAIPLKVQKLETVQTNIRDSKIITTLSGFLHIQDKNPVEALTNIAEILKDPEKAEMARETPGYKNLVSTPTIKDLLRDKETLRQIEEKDFAALLKNEKIKNLINDPDAMDKIFEFQKDLMTTSLKTNNPT